jgi:hypothetical protein
MPGEQRKYGTTIAPGLYAPVHQHFFVARMDMAVDCKPNEPYNQLGLSVSDIYSCDDQKIHLQILKSALHPTCTP